MISRKRQANLGSCGCFLSLIFLLSSQHPKQLQQSAFEFPSASFFMLFLKQSWWILKTDKEHGVIMEVN